MHAQMKVEYLLLLTFALTCFVKSIKVGWTIHALTDVIPDTDDRKYTVVSGNKIIVARQSVLSLHNLNGTLSEVTLDFPLDEIYAYNLISGLHVIVAAHAEQSTLDEVSHCTGDRDSGQLSCNRYERYTPPTTFVVSIRIVDNSTVTVWAVYYENDYLTYYNVIGGHEQHSLKLPENCTCSSNCLTSVKEPKGRVIIQCLNGTAYLYELYSERFFVLPPEVKQVVTSNYKDLTIVTKPAEGLHQDILVEINMTTDMESAAALPLAGSLANSSSPVNIQDMAIVSVNKTTLSEIFYFLRNNKVFYFNVDKLGIYPEIEYLPLPPDITLIGIRGCYESSVVIEGIFSNGSLVLLVIEAQPGNKSSDGMDCNNTGSNTTPLPTSHTLDPPHSTESPSPCTIAKPKPTNTVNDQVNPAPISECSRLEPASFAYGIIVGCIPTVVIAFVVVIILYRITKSKGKLPV